MVATNGLSHQKVHPRMSGMHHHQDSPPSGKPSGKPSPLPVPCHPWAHLWVDFVTQLTYLRWLHPGHSRLVLWFSKPCCLIPLKLVLIPMKTAELLFNHIFHNYGLPEDVVSDPGPQFISWVCLLLTPSPPELLEPLLCLGWVRTELPLPAS